MPTTSPHIAATVARLLPDAKRFLCEFTGFWWTSSEYPESTLFSEWKFNDAFAVALGLKSSGYGFYHNNKLTGYSIRCIKDN